MKFKKSKILILFFLFIASPLFSIDTSLELVLLSSGITVGNVQRDGFDNVVSIYSDEDLLYFDSQLKADFDLNWTDKNIHENSRRILANYLSPLLSTLLPCKAAIYSKSLLQSDGSKSFRFMDLSTNKVYSVIYKDRKIISLSLI